eukprot:3892581-Pleurochrysis_carterae.AAC.1
MEGGASVLGREAELLQHLRARRWAEGDDEVEVLVRRVVPVRLVEVLQGHRRRAVDAAEVLQHAHERA